LSKKTEQERGNKTGRIQKKEKVEVGVAGLLLTRFLTELRGLANGTAGGGFEKQKTSGGKKSVSSNKILGSLVEKGTKRAESGGEKKKTKGF